MIKKLLLWDIDGTLISTGMAGVNAFLLAIEKVFGIQTTRDGVEFAGRTDIRIMHSMFKKLSIAATVENLENLKKAYFQCLAEELPRHQGKVHPGILEILQESQKRKDIVLGLLTGNLSRAAELKLTHYKIWHFFEFGVFADDSMDRNELGPIALRRAMEKYKHEFAPKNVLIIGDTPHDIECGKVIGAQTIAVATGGYSYEKLQPHSPTILFHDLKDTQKFFEVMNKD